MAKFELRFLCDSDDRAYCTINKFIEDDYQVIELRVFDEEGKNQLIIFDKSTAIKFAKTLRTEINKITEREVSNG